MAYAGNAGNILKVNTSMRHMTCWGSRRSVKEDMCQALTVLVCGHFFMIDVKDTDVSVNFSCIFMSMSVLRAILDINLI